MKIIEFYGMPGCGKSTISHEVAVYLRKLGYTVIEPSWVLDNKYSTIRRITQKLILSIIFSTTHPLVVSKLICSAKLRNNSFKSIIKQWVNISYTLFYEMKNVKCDYMIMDEGIAQAIVSLYTESSNDNYSMKYEHLINDIKCFRATFYIKITKKESLLRLEKRGTFYSRVDRLKGKQKLVMLKRIESICNRLSYKSILIDNNSDVKLAIKKVINSLNT